MNIADFRVSKIPVEVELAAEAWVKKFRRDFFIISALIPLIFIFELATNIPVVDTYVPILILMCFADFIFRMFYFAYRYRSYNQCPSCSRPLLTHKELGLKIIACNHCQLVFCATKPSDDPEKISESIVLIPNTRFADNFEKSFYEPTT